jgi:hypothetical protein
VAEIVESEAVSVGYLHATPAAIAAFREWHLSKTDAQIGTLPFFILDGKTKSLSPV